MAWAFFVAAILAIPIASWQGRFGVAMFCAGVVAVECVILMVNGMRCPLTPMAERYTEDRRPNFDIYLPQFVARFNKEIFGTLYVAGMAYAVARWLSR